MNEIKYLSAQKKVPKLTLRKEILHLENKLEGIFELENKLLKNKQQESLKITSLKRQIAHLKKKLSTCEDKNLHKKVEKLSHLLGDSLAHKASNKDAKAYTLLEEERKKQEESNINLFQTILHRLNALKQELEIIRHVEEKDPQQINALEQKVLFLSKRLKEYQERHPECIIQEIELEQPLTNEQIEHKFLYHESVADVDPLSQLDLGKIDRELEQELPLPPPPRTME